MIDPRMMCNQHLLGEHKEIHMLAGSLTRGKSIKGYLTRGLLEPQNLYDRHDALVEEMTRRGFKHKSELPSLEYIELPQGMVVRLDSVRDLKERCSRCLSLIGS